MVFAPHWYPSPPKSLFQRAVTRIARARSFLKPFTGVRKLLVIIIPFNSKISLNMDTSLWLKRVWLMESADGYKVGVSLQYKFCRYAHRATRCYSREEGFGTECAMLWIGKGFGWNHVCPSLFLSLSTAKLILILRLWNYNPYNDD